jgi:hypothetical protein
VLRRPGPRLKSPRPFQRFLALSRVGNDLLYSPSGATSECERGTEIEVVRAAPNDSTEIVRTVTSVLTSPFEPSDRPNRRPLHTSPNILSGCTLRSLLVADGFVLDLLGTVGLIVRRGRL